MPWSRFVDGQYIAQPPCGAPGRPLGSKRGLRAVSAGPPHPRAVSAGPPHPRACTPLGDLKVPERQRAFDVLRAGPPSSFEQLRELAERHRREDADIREALRRVRAARRPVWRPPVVHACPTSTPRPRERGACMVVASGRDGTAGRDDGGGDSDGGGSSDPPPPHLKSEYGPRAEAQFNSSRSRAPRVPSDGRARQ